MFLGFYGVGNDGILGNHGVWDDCVFWAVMGSGMMFLGCHGVSNDGVLAHCSEVFGCCLDGVFGAGVGYYEGR